MPYWTARQLTLGQVVQLALSYFGAIPRSCKCIDGETAVRDDHYHLNSDAECGIELPQHVQLTLNGGKLAATIKELGTSLLFSSCQEVSLTLAFAGAEAGGHGILASLRYNGSSISAQHASRALRKGLLDENPDARERHCAISNLPDFRMSALEAMHILPPGFDATATRYILGLTADEATDGLQPARLIDTVDESIREELEESNTHAQALALFDPRLLPLEDFEPNEPYNALWVMPPMRQLFDKGEFAVLQNRIVPLLDPVNRHLAAAAWSIEKTGKGTREVKAWKLDYKTINYGRNEALGNGIRRCIWFDFAEARLEKWMLLHIKSAYNFYQAYTPSISKTALEDLFLPAAACQAGMAVTSKRPCSEPSASSSDSAMPQVSANSNDLAPGQIQRGPKLEQVGEAAEGLEQGAIAPTVAPANSDGWEHARGLSRQGDEGFAKFLIWTSAAKLAARGGRPSDAQSGAAAGSVGLGA